MSLNFTIQQKQAIAEYRQQHNISSSVNDSQVVSQMIKSGQIPACFASLAAGQSTSPANNNVFSGTQKTQSLNQQNKSEQNQLNKELASLGLTNRNGAGEKITIGNNEYTVVGEANNGRKIVQDSKGQLQIISHDNKILNKDYVIQKNATDAIKNNPKVAQNTTIKLLEAHVKNAETAFEKQLAEDGWAGDFADGISVLWGSDNRASKVSKDIEKYKKDLANLQKAAEQGDKNFNAKFKNMFGVDFNQQAIADYVQNPTDKNYQKAFGTKNNINKRVNDYNKSQQTGATVVKGSATVAAGVAIGVATAGTGIAAVGMAAAGTAASSAAINVSDRLTSDVGLKEGDLQNILKTAAWDGVSVAAGGAVGKLASTAIKGVTTTAKAGRAAVSAAGDTAVGAAQEYAETGQVTAAGTMMNAALGSVGIAAEAGVLNKAGRKISNALSRTDSSDKPHTAQIPETSQNTQAGIAENPVNSSEYAMDANTSTKTNSGAADVKTMSLEEKKEIAKNFYINASSQNMTADDVKQVISNFRDNMDILNLKEVQDVIIKNHEKYDITINRGEAPGTFTLTHTNKDQNFGMDDFNRFLDALPKVITDMDQFLNAIPTKTKLSVADELNDALSVHYQYQITDGKPHLLGKELVKDIYKDHKEVITQFPDGTYKKETFKYTERRGHISNSAASLTETYDKDGNLLTRTLSKPSKFNNRKNINVTLREIYDGNGNVTEVQNLGNVTVYNSNRDVFKIDRQYNSPDGTVSRQSVIERPNSRYTDFQVGNERLTRRFSKFADGTTTRVNDEVYRAKFDNGEITITREGKNGQSETVKIDADQLDPQLTDLYKNLPGDILYNLKQKNIKVKLGEAGEVPTGNAICKYSKEEDGSIGCKIVMSKVTANDPFVFAHEYGHALDIKLKGLRFDSDLVNIYKKELDNYNAQATSAGREAIGYMSLANTNGKNGGLAELIAETTAITSGLQHDKTFVLERARILQENFPQTMEYILGKINPSTV